MNDTAHNEPDGPTVVATVQPMIGADEVARLTGLAKPTVYQIAREDPKRLGAEYFGRSVRFARPIVERLVRGDV